jgi:RNA polymerase sigma factor (sigma-70 family)
MTSRGIAAFPDTRPSLIQVLGSGGLEARAAALDSLVAVYWRPVYTRYRLKWHLDPADAEDLVQEFFVGAMDGTVFERYDPARSKLRTFLRVCADRFAANADRGRRRLKRGGAVVQVPVDLPGVERELAQGSGAGSEAEADAWFEREWIRALFDDAVARLVAATAGTSRELRVTLLRRYDLQPARDADRPSYRELAREFELSVTQVTNHLAWARGELRRLLLERLRTLAGSEAEFRGEAAELLRGELG